MREWADTETDLRDLRCYIIDGCVHGDCQGCNLGEVVLCALLEGYE